VFQEPAAGKMTQVRMIEGGALLTPATRTPVHAAVKARQADRLRRFTVTHITPSK
jgi:hypothetical protein